MKIEILNELVAGILEIMRPSAVQIILYGSVARGTDTEESDVDIAVLITVDWIKTWRTGFLIS